MHVVLTNSAERPYGDEVAAADRHQVLASE